MSVCRHAGALIKQQQIQREREYRQVISGEVAVGFALGVGACFACSEICSDSGARA
jgi:hypothetical protein